MDPHYIISWSHRLLLLDPAAKTATEVATFDTTAHSQASFETVSSSRDGRVLLVTAGSSASDWSLFLIRPGTAEVQRIIHRVGLTRVLTSPDGSRFAVAVNEIGGSRTGLWVGRVADGTMRRLVADDPSFGFQTIPLGFSPDGATLAFATGVGGIVRAGLVSTEAAEVRVDRTAEPAIAGSTMIGAATNAEFISDREIFLWNSDRFGTTVAYTYDIVRKTTTQLYQAPQRVLMEAAWRPGAQSFATIERVAGGINPPGTGWLRGRSGAPRSFGEVSGFLGRIWWSRDGTRLYALRGGDDSTGAVIELLSGESVIGYCLRGGDWPRCV